MRCDIGIPILAVAFRPGIIPVQSAVENHVFPAAFRALYFETVVKIRNHGTADPDLRAKAENAFRAQKYVSVLIAVPAAVILFQEFFPVFDLGLLLFGIGIPIDCKSSALTGTHDMKTGRMFPLLHIGRNALQIRGDAIHTDSFSKLFSGLCYPSGAVKTETIAFSLPRYYACLRIIRPTEEQTFSCGTSRSAPVKRSYAKSRTDHRQNRSHYTFFAGHCQRRRAGKEGGDPGLLVRPGSAERTRGAISRRR